MRLGDLDALKADLIHDYAYAAASMVDKQPTIDAVPVAEIKTYLQKRLDEWNALGDRKYEPANMWGYNFIMACFDDIERRDTDG